MLNLIDLIFTSASVIGTAAGFVGAGLAWWLLPESVDRASVGGWIIAVGFVCGLVWAGVSEKKQKT